MPSSPLLFFAGVAALTSSAPPSVTGFSADVSGSARRPAPGLLAETPPRGPTIDGAEGVTSGVSYREGGRFFVRSLKRRGTCGGGAGVRGVSGAPQARLGRISGASRLDCLHEVDHLHAGRVVRPGVRRQLAHTLDDLVGAQHLPRGGRGYTWRRASRKTDCARERAEAAPTTARAHDRPGCCRGAHLVHARAARRVDDEEARDAQVQRARVAGGYRLVLAAHDLPREALGARGGEGRCGGGTGGCDISGRGARISARPQRDLGAPPCSRPRRAGGTYTARRAGSRVTTCRTWSCTACCAIPRATRSTACRPACARAPPSS